MLGAFEFRNKNYCTEEKIVPIIALLGVRRVSFLQALSRTQNISAMSSQIPLYCALETRIESLRPQLQCAYTNSHGAVEQTVLDEQPSVLPNAYRNTNQPSWRKLKQNQYLALSLDI